VLHLSFSSYPSSLSLIGKTDTTSEAVAHLVTDSLFQYDATLRLVPRLAASWKVSADGREVTFRLRDGIRWQDGTPVTARDVAFTIRKVREPATEARSYLAAFQDVQDLEVLDPHALRVRYKAPYADFLDAWTLPILPEHLAGREPDLLTSEYARRPVGCGPFRIAAAEPGQRLVLEANRDYWDTPATINRLEFHVLPDERTAYRALLRGDLDLLAVSPDTWRDASRSPEAARLGRLMYSRLNVWYVAWNQDGSNPFFTEAPVRRAMVLTLDRGAMIDRVLSGLGRPGVTTYHPDSPWCDPSVKPWPFDPAEASRLLDAAGWTRDGEGVRRRGGSKFSFTLLIPAGTQEMTDRIAAWMQQSLASVGVEMGIEKLEWKTFLERRRSHRFEASMAALQLTPTPDQFELYHSTSRSGGMNFMGLADPEVDRLLEEGRRTFDQARRHATYATLQRRLHELEPISCLFHFTVPVLHHPGLRGIQPSPLGFWLITPGIRAWRFEDARDAG
jgi:peptide/nickel transport system substrate-binding protein